MWFCFQNSKECLDQIALKAMVQHGLEIKEFIFYTDVCSGRSYNLKAHDFDLSDNQTWMQ